MARGWIATGRSWKADTSPILHAEIYDGETTTPEEQQGWNTLQFTGAQWKPVDR